MARHSRGRVVPQSRRSSRRLWLGLPLLIMIGAALLAFITLGGSRTAALVPEHTTHDFGTVSMRDGEISARIPLSVQQPTVVTDVNSS